jgi:hypothetical protein
MFSAKAFHNVGSKVAFGKFLGSGGEFFAPVFMAEGCTEIPTIRVPVGKRLRRKRLYKAGISFRLVKSPEAPKITIV